MWVAKQMGHTDWTMIARVYGRWMSSADETAGVKAESAFAGNTNYNPIGASTVSERELELK